MRVVTASACPRWWWRAPPCRLTSALVDLDARIPSDMVCACGQVDPSIMAAAGPYLAMLATPKILDSVQEKAPAALLTGWRQPYADGPTRDELVELALSPVP